MSLILEELIHYLNVLSQRLIRLLRKFKKLLRDNKQSIYDATYALYGLLDGMSVAYSTLKYGCDLLASSSSESREMIHTALTTPGGILAVTLESIVLVSFSIFANTVGKSKNDFRRYFATIWPYMRDSLKGMKNSYRGLKSALAVTSQLSGSDLKMLVMPAGIIIGVLTVINRIWIRNMRNKRKDMMSFNKALLKKILKAEEITRNDDGSENDYKKLLKEIKRQSSSSKRFALYGASVFAGISDGFYLFMGMFTVASITGPLFTVLALICFAFVLINVVTRMSEEYEYQKKLEKTQLDCELALEGKILMQSISGLMKMRKEHFLSGKVSDLLVDENYKKALDEYLQLKNSYLKKKQQRAKIIEPSLKRAFFEGLRAGLFAYGAIASIMFAASTLMLLTTLTFPPLVVAAVIFSGIVCMLGFTLYTTIQAYKKQKNQAELDKEANRGVTEEALIIKFENELKEDFFNPNPIDNNHLQRAFADTLVTDDSPQYHFQEGFEVVRSIASGLGKGQKTVEFTFQSMETQDTSGDYHETTFMVVTTCVMSLIYATCMGIRAIHKGFDRGDSAKPEQPEISTSATLQAQADEDNNVITPLESKAQNHSQKKVQEPKPVKRSTVTFLKEPKSRSLSQGFFGIKNNKKRVQSSSPDLFLDSRYRLNASLN